MQPQMIDQRNLKVILPLKIFTNIKDLFWNFLECLKQDIITPLAQHSMNTNGGTTKQLSAVVH
jgi:hypothetical protein